MAKKIYGVLLDVYNGTAKAVEVEDSLEKFYEILDCRCIDIVERAIGGFGKGHRRKNFSFVCDDEGLLRENPKISAIDNIGRPQLVGNLFIVGAGCDEDGEMIGLEKSEATYILKRIIPLATQKHPEPYPILTQVEYY